MTKLKAARVFSGIRSGHIRWVILFLLFIATVLNYLDRQVMAVLADTICKDLELDNKAFANVINIFQLAVILASFVAGPMLDRWGVRMGFVISIIVWSIGGGLTAIASTLTVFYVFRFILGVGEAGSFPASGKAVAEWFPAKERAFSMGFFNSGVSLGAILAAPAVWFFTSFTNSWRWTFVVAAALSIPWIILWLYYYHPLDRHPRVREEERQLINSDRIKAKGGGKVYGVLHKPAFWGLFGARFIISPIWFFIAYWVFKYFATEFGFDLKKQAMYAWIPFATSALGNMVGGYLSGRLIARGIAPKKARKWLMLVGALAMATCFLTAYTNVWYIALALISFLTFAWGIWVSNMLGLVADSFPSNEVATVMSWTTLGQYAGSMIFTWYIGYIVDKTGGNYASVFVVAAFLPIIGHICTMLLNREEKPAATTVA